MSDPLQYLLEEAERRKLHPSGLEIETLSLRRWSVCRVGGGDEGPAATFYKNRFYHVDPMQRFVDAFADCTGEVYAYRPSGHLFVAMYCARETPLDERGGAALRQWENDRRVPFPAALMDRWDVTYHAPGSSEDYYAVDNPEILLRFRRDRKEVPRLVAWYTADYATQLREGSAWTEQLVTRAEVPRLLSHRLVEGVLEMANSAHYSTWRVSEIFSRPKLLSRAAQHLEGIADRIREYRSETFPLISSQKRLWLDPERYPHLAKIRTGMRHERALSLLLADFEEERRWFDSGECDGEPELSLVYDEIQPAEARSVH